MLIFGTQPGLLNKTLVTVCGEVREAEVEDRRNRKAEATLAGRMCMEEHWSKPGFLAM